MDLKPGSGPGRTFSLDGDSRGYPGISHHSQSVIKCQNGFTHANHPVRTIAGAITSRIDIRIGHFPKESIAGAIISFVCGRLG